jgi:general secretion pathway protein A
MYLEHFELSETPFKITPDPRFLWYSDQHKEAKAKIEFHINQKDGSVVSVQGLQKGRRYAVDQTESACGCTTARERFRSTMRSFSYTP